MLQTPYTSFLGGFHSHGHDITFAIPCIRSGEVVMLGASRTIVERVNRVIFQTYLFCPWWNFLFCKMYYLSEITSQCMYVCKKNKLCRSLMFSLVQPTKFYLITLFSYIKTFINHESKQTFLSITNFGKWFSSSRLNLVFGANCSIILWCYSQLLI
jgi:hypothetical protein